MSGMSIVQLFARVDESSARLEKENAAYTLANKVIVLSGALILAWLI